MTASLHDSERAALMETRAMLRTMDTRIRGGSLGEGRMLEAIETARSAIFRVLVIDSAYGGVELTDAELLGTPGLSVGAATTSLGQVDYYATGTPHPKPDAKP